MKFRGYQQDLIDTALPILKPHKFLYLAMEVRTGKTLTSLGVSELLPIKNLLFITKKKAISSIQDDYDELMDTEKELDDYTNEEIYDEILDEIVTPNKSIH